MADTERHPGGRPLKFQSVAELQNRIDAYFADCDPHVEHVTEWVEARSRKGDLLKDENGLNYLVEVTHKVMTKQKPYTITGLAVWLDTSRETLLDYEDRPEFSDTIKAAKNRVEAFWEVQLLGSNAAGPIFNLKNNYGWKDKSERELTGKDGGPIETKTIEVMDVGGSHVIKEKASNEEEADD